MAKTGLQAAKGANHHGAGDPQLHETLPPMVSAMVDGDDWLHRPRTILEPACGPGAMARQLQACGHRVIASDLYNYGERWKGRAGSGRPIWGKSFFEWSRADLADYLARLGEAIDGDNFAIMTNPPFATGIAGDVSLAARFAAHALTLAPRVFMLLRADFQHGGKKCPLRDGLMESDRFTGLFPLRERVALHRDDFTGVKQSGFFDYSWFRWSRAGDPFVFRRLSVEGGGYARPVIYSN